MTSGLLKTYILTFLISMVPIVELRGAIPWGTAVAAEPIPILHAYIISIIGNMIPVPFIFFFARKILEWGSNKPVIGGFFTWCLNKGHKGGEKLMKNGRQGVYIALLFFVGIPLPGTGAWTGTLAASFLDMNFKKSVICVMGGVLLAGIIIGTLSMFGINLLK